MLIPYLYRLNFQELYMLCLSEFHDDIKDKSGDSLQVI